MVVRRCVLLLLRDTVGYGDTKGRQVLGSKLEWRRRSLQDCFKRLGYFSDMMRVVDSGLIIVWASVVWRVYNTMVATSQFILKTGIGECCMNE